MAQRRAGLLRRHRTLVIGLIVALVVLSVPVVWVIQTRVLVPHGAPTPMAALGRFETAVRSGDHDAVERALGPGSVTWPTTGQYADPDRIADVMEKYAAPDFRFTSVTLRETESGSFLFADATATVRSESRRFELAVMATMSLDTGETLGWFVSP